MGAAGMANPNWSIHTNGDLDLASKQQSVQESG